MSYYAQVSGGIVVAVTQTSGPIESPDMVGLESCQSELLGWTYAGGVFTPPPPPEVP